MKNEYDYESPIGVLRITDDGQGITSIGFNFGNWEPLVCPIKSTLITQTIMELEEYFQGVRKVFTVPLNPKGTDFQKKVWQALQDIPYGQTCSYKDVAKAVGNDKASRAIGMANNKNPIPIIVPCHRVIGSGGKLVGYAGGLDVKRMLLQIEG